MTPPEHDRRRHCQLELVAFPRARPGRCRACSPASRSARAAVGPSSGAAPGPTCRDPRPGLSSARARWAAGRRLRAGCGTAGSSAARRCPTTGTRRGRCPPGRRGVLGQRAGGGGREEVARFGRPPFRCRQTLLPGDVPVRPHHAQMGVLVLLFRGGSHLGVRASGRCPGVAGLGFRGLGSSWPGVGGGQIVRISWSPGEKLPVSGVGTPSIRGPWSISATLGFSRALPCASRPLTGTDRNRSNILGVQQWGRSCHVGKR